MILQKKHQRDLDYNLDFPHAEGKGVEVELWFLLLWVCCLIEGLVGVCILTPKPFWACLEVRVAWGVRWLVW